jgi:PAS domain-containing protein
VTLRQRPAADIVADPHFERLLHALEEATSPAIPHRVLEVFFVTSDGSVGEVLDEVVRAYPQTVSIEVLLEDARWVGALEQARLAAEVEEDLALIRAELDAVRAGMSRWDSFMQGREFRLPDATTRMNRAALRSTDRSHPSRRRRPPERRIEHP